MKKRLREKYEQPFCLVVCANCGKIKKHTRWVRLSKEEEEKLTKKFNEAKVTRIILESCGCLGGGK